MSKYLWIIFMIWLHYGSFYFLLFSTPLPLSLIFLFHRMHICAMLCDNLWHILSFYLLFFLFFPLHYFSFLSFPILTYPFHFFFYPPYFFFELFLRSLFPILPFPSFTSLSYLISEILDRDNDWIGLSQYHCELDILQ